MSSRVRLFFILWLAGLAGVLSFQLVDIPVLIAKLPNSQGKALPLPLPIIRILSFVQPAVLVGIAVFEGLVLAPKVGLSAPASQAWAERPPFLPALLPQLLPGADLGHPVSKCWCARRRRSFRQQLRSN